MRDYPELNRLLLGEESSNSMISWAVLNTIDDFNTTPPIIGTYTLENFPSASLLLLGTAADLLLSVGQLRTRNTLPSSDGGIQIDTENAHSFINLAERLNLRYEQKKLRLKKQLNIEAAYGAGAHSQYKSVNQYLNSLRREGIINYD